MKEEAMKRDKERYLSGEDFKGNCLAKVEILLEMTGKPSLVQRLEFSG